MAVRGNRARILVVDGDSSAGADVSRPLRARGYDVQLVSTVPDALASLRLQTPDLVILDLDLPHADGARACRRIRRKSAIPIIAVSVRGTDADKIAVLDHGADDYLTKPFSPGELAARIRAVLRRVAEHRDRSDQLKVGDLTIDCDRHRVFRGDQPIHLTPKEFDLLTLLARNADRVLTHQSILETLWGAKASAKPEYVWTLVSYLRKKLEPDGTKSRYLISEPSVGYRLASEAEATASA